MTGGGKRVLWVRTRESRGGLSEGGKGRLLHGQLVELGQLLRGSGGNSKAERLLSQKDACYDYTKKNQLENKQN